MARGFNFVYERQRVRLRVYRRLFFPNYLDIGDKTHCIYVDTWCQYQIDYDNPEDYNHDNPMKQVALYRLAKASRTASCIMKNGILHCDVIIGTPEEVNGQSIPGVAWVPFNPKRQVSFEDRVQQLRSQQSWIERLK